MVGVRKSKHALEGDRSVKTGAEMRYELHKEILEGRKVMSASARAHLQGRFKLDTHEKEADQ